MITGFFVRRLADRNDREVRLCFRNLCFVWSASRRICTLGFVSFQYGGKNGTMRGETGRVKHKSSMQKFLLAGFSVVTFALGSMLMMSSDFRGAVLGDTTTAGTANPLTTTTTSATGAIGTANTSATQTVTAPAVPSGVSASLSGSVVNVSWRASSGAMRYKVYRGDAVLVTTENLQFQDTTAHVATSYYYFVSAVNSSGMESAKSSAVLVKTPAATTIATTSTTTGTVGGTATGTTTTTTTTTGAAAPAVPTGVTANATGPSTVAIGWTASSGATGYKVYRGDALLATTTGSRYTDTTAHASTTYRYSVSSLNSIGTESVKSAVASVTTLAATTSATMTTTTGGSVTGTAGTTTATTSTTHDTSSQTNTASVAQPSAATTATTSLTRSSSEISGTSSSANGSGTDTAVTTAVGSTLIGEVSALSADNVPPTVPTDVSAAAVGETTIRVKWQASTDNVGIANYVVYRDSSPIGTTKGLYYDDISVKPGELHDYSVVARDTAKNESGRTASVQIVVPGTRTGVLAVADSAAVALIEKPIVITAGAVPDVSKENIDTDHDGLSDAEELRLGTDPNVADTDGDGFSDGEEVKAGFDPLKYSAGDKSDKIVFQPPVTAPEKVKTVEDTRYAVKKVELVKSKDGKDVARFSGKALPNAFVTLYIYSDPVVVVVKTDDDGNWSYDLDSSLGNGNHQVYVAVTDNLGRVTAQSSPLPFVKTAEAITTQDAAKSVAPNLSPLQRGMMQFVGAGVAIAALFMIVALLIIAKRQAKVSEGNDGNNDMMV